MELKVWTDGYQRVVCGVTKQTTCQDVMIALAHATGKTGRYVMVEKWHTSERHLSPSDYPLLILQKWGEYASDIQFVLHYVAAGTGVGIAKRGAGAKNHRLSKEFVRHPHQRLIKKCQLKKSLTFSGAHNWSRVGEDSTTTTTSRPVGQENRLTVNVDNSVDSSEQSSVASRSSASISPYASLDRRRPEKDDEPQRNTLIKAEWLGKKQPSQRDHDVRPGILKLASQLVARQPWPPTAENGKNSLSPKLSSFGSSLVSSVTTSSSNSSVSSQIPLPAPRTRKPAIPPTEDVVSKTTSLESQGGKKILPNGVPLSSVSSIPSSVPVAKSRTTLVGDHAAETSVKGRYGFRTAQVASSSYQQKNAASSSCLEKNNLYLQKKTLHSQEGKQETDAKTQLISSRENDFRIGLSSAIRTTETGSAFSSTSNAHNSISVERSANEERDGEKSSTDKNELIKLINRQEEEIQKYQSSLGIINDEISVLSSDVKTDEDELDVQLERIEELEKTEKEMENELEELELVSWEEKLTMEKQKENRMRTEILLLRSSIAKSETEIKSVTEKIKLLTRKTEEAMKELNNCLEEQKYNDKKLISVLESELNDLNSKSRTSEEMISKLGEEICTAEQSLSWKKEELENLEKKLKKTNLEHFLQDPLEHNKRSRNASVDRLCLLSRPGSGRKLQRNRLNHSPFQMNQTVDETNESHGYIV